MLPLPNLDPVRPVGVASPGSNALQKTEHDCFREGVRDSKVNATPAKDFGELLGTLRRMGGAEIQIDAIIFCPREEKELSVTPP